MIERLLRNRIKVVRAMRDMTQADVALRAGVARRSVNAIETGRMVPSVVLALRIAHALGVPVETLFSLSSRTDEEEVAALRDAVAHPAELPAGRANGPRQG